MTTDSNLNPSCIKLELGFWQCVKNNFLNICLYEPVHFKIMQFFKISLLFPTSWNTKEIKMFFLQKAKNISVEHKVLKSYFGSNYHFSYLLLHNNECDPIEIQGVSGSLLKCSSLLPRLEGNLLAKTGDIFFFWLGHFDN